MSQNAEEKIQAASLLDWRESKVIYYIVNLIPMIMLMLHFFSIQGCVITVAFNIFLFVRMIVKVDTERTAANYLSTMLFVDVCIGIGVFWEPLLQNVMLENIKKFWDGVTIQTIVVLCIGFVMGLISLQKEKLYWLSWIGAEIAGCAVILQLYGNGEILAPDFSEGGWELLVLFVICGGIWFFISQIDVLLEQERKTVNIRMGFVLMLGVLFVLIAENQYVNQMLPEIRQFYRSLSQEVFAWWKIWLSCGVLAVLGIALSQHSARIYKIDGTVYCFLATGILTIKLILTNYFFFNWVVFAIYVLSVFWGITRVNKQVTSREEVVWLGIQSVTMVVIIKFLEWGLWMNLVVTTVFVVLFSSFYKNRKQLSFKQRRVLFIYIIIGIAAETLTFIWTLRFQISKVMVVGVLSVAVLGIILIITWPHPENRQVHNKYKIGICIVFAVLCLMTAVKSGSKITTNINEEEQTISVNVDAKGTDSKVKNVTCIWTNQFGKQIGEELSFKRGEQILAIEAENLTITAIDQNGVRTVCKERVPYWLVPSEESSDK